VAVLEVEATVRYDTIGAAALQAGGVTVNASLGVAIADRYRAMVAMHFMLRFGRGRLWVQ